MDNCKAYRACKKTHTVKEFELVGDITVRNDKFFLTYIDSTGKKVKNRIRSSTHRWFGTQKEALEWLIEYNESQRALHETGLKWANERLDNLRNLLPSGGKN